VDIIQKLEEAKLTGRGGASFPTAKKWALIKAIQSEKKYIVCNGAEGEPGVMKDGYLLEHHPDIVIEGIIIALQTFENSEAFLYLNHDYFDRFHEKLEKLIGKKPITLWRKRGKYLGGEETVLCEVIENKFPSPRHRPPYPAQAGIWGFPTLINNVETFYDVAKIARGEYHRTRWYSVSGFIPNPGVFELPEYLTIAQVLRQTKNMDAQLPPSHFVQAGGGASGEILLPTELDRPVPGGGAILVYDKNEISPTTLMKQWVDFYLQANCDKCVPCREGVFRLKEMLDKNAFDMKTADDLFFAMENASFCGLGQGIPLPFRSLLEKVKV
jgi:NADH:ubiquinone oxidoreductase subunit F (NADH-binding)